VTPPQGPPTLPDDEPVLDEELADDMLPLEDTLPPDDDVLPLDDDMLPPEDMLPLDDDMLPPEDMPPPDDVLVDPFPEDAPPLPALPTGLTPALQAGSARWGSRRPR
jgi:hypothetical protein